MGKAPILLRLRTIRKNPDQLKNQKKNRNQALKPRKDTNESKDVECLYMRKRATMEGSVVIENEIKIKAKLIS